MRTRIICPLFALGVVLFFSKTAFSQSPNIYTFPGPDVDLGQSDIGRVVSGGHYIGGRGNTVYVLRQLNHTYCHKSTDGGLTFGSGVQVNSTSAAVNASLRVDTAGVVYVAYQSSADIYFTKSTDGGQTFTPGIKVNDDTIPQTGQQKPALCVNNKGQIFIAWEDQRGIPSYDQSVRTLFTSASFDSGKSFSPNVQVADSFLPVVWGIDIIADDIGRVYIVWNSFLDLDNKGPIYLVRSDDSGGNFGSEALVTDLPSDTVWARGFFPSLALGGESLGWHGRTDASNNIVCVLRQATILVRLSLRE